MPEKVHALLRPDTTCCGHSGRATTISENPVIIEDGDSADRIFRIGKPVTCAKCAKRIAGRGHPLPWQETHGRPHAASAESQRRARHRRSRRKRKD